MSIRLQLFLFGLLILAYLGARWWWWERKYRQGGTVNKVEGEPLERIEPSGLAQTLDAAPLPVQAQDAFPNLPAGPHLESISRRGSLHPSIDCMAKLELDTPCEGSAVVALLPATRRVGSKTWAIEGFNSQSECWETLSPELRYSALQAGIQLVNRHGALQDVEFSEFVVKTGELADSLGASVDFPEMLAEVSRARELEQFVLGHDIRLSLNLHAKRAAWSLPYLQQQVQKLGFVAGAIPGRWVLGQSEHEMLALTIDVHAAMADNPEAIPIRKLSLTLNVPHVARGDDLVGKPFDVLADRAIRLSASMEAAILDEQGLSVDVAALQRTSEELEQVYDRLDAEGLAAGSLLAKRLFS